jgi:hypothetical protein
MRRLGALAAALAAGFKGLAPYAAMALVVPGGSLLAPLLWFYRRLRKPSAVPSPLSVLPRNGWQTVTRP